jgi:Mn2+/Fe2+ NRAMP family transporter
VSRARPLSLRALLPGMLVAATGVGAGDLSTSALAGSATGVSLLWAVVLGCAMKALLTEGIARQQLATGQSLLAAVVTRLPHALLCLLAGYFVVWTFLVGAALMSAMGVVLHACAPLLRDAHHDKVLYGVASSLLGLLVVRHGGWRWFERCMAVCTAVMAVVVVGCAVALAPDWGEVLRGLVVPRVPAGTAGHTWAIALMGGIGGTVTLLCYGYWIDCKGRRLPADLPTCRVDLAAAYLVTALFGIGMVIVGSRVQFAGDGGGATLAVQLSTQLGQVLGPIGSASFLAGAFAAVCSSLLGVWHSVPALFAAAWHARAGGNDDRLVHTTAAYRVLQWALALVPMLGLAAGFARMQKAYAVVGSLFTPLLALALWWALRRPELGTLRARPWHAALFLAIAGFYGVELWQTMRPA